MFRNSATQLSVFWKSEKEQKGTSQSHTVLTSYVAYPASNSIDISLTLLQIPLVLHVFCSGLAVNVALCML